MSQRVHRDVYLGAHAPLGFIIDRAVATDGRALNRAAVGALHLQVYQKNLLRRSWKFAKWFDEGQSTFWTHLVWQLRCHIWMHRTVKYIV